MSKMSEVEYPKKIVRICIEVIEKENKRYIVHHTIEENDTTMLTTSLLLYKMKQIEQELIDRVCDNGGQGYEIIDEGKG